MVDKDKFLFVSTLTVGGDQEMRSVVRRCIAWLTFMLSRLHLSFWLSIYLVLMEHTAHFSDKRLGYILWVDIINDDEKICKKASNTVYQKMHKMTLISGWRKYFQQKIWKALFSFITRRISIYLGIVFIF